MKKYCITILVVCLLVMLGGNIYATNGLAGTLAPQAAAAFSFTSGQMQTGTFPTFPETHTYSVYLQGNKGVAFQAYGISVISMTVYAPNGSYVGAISKISGTSSFYGVLTTPNQSGNYTIQVYGAYGMYAINCLTGYAQTANTNTEYKGWAAAGYARAYANNPNPVYPDYSNNGGDCTNFASQSVKAGGMAVKAGGTTDAYWHHTSSGNRSPSWTSADFFMRHWTKVRLSSYYGRAYSVRIYTKDYVLKNKAAVESFLTLGTVIHYLDVSNSNAYHSHVISEINPSNVKFCSRSDPLVDASWYNYIDESIYETQWIVAVRISKNPS